ncbi:hypothetical protein [Arthrobacter mangrovi]|uniref:Uncharacterized protein n=1 Tax=Arthrobacter mangrovi TaxID=2966350 RepID=A0ABQ5MY33_9MICC|nr:hypothetical protein [Arthrobacter mangrovi]GLB68740.1 hypothetical protein AHIS1636_31820 [Arthrobacter mangrovi]
MTGDTAAVWSRALHQQHGRPRTDGDRALHDLLVLDNLAQSSGLVQAVRTLKAWELASAVAGYRWFGLNRLADGIESVAAEAATIKFYTPESHHQQTLLEERAVSLFFGIEGSDLLEDAVEACVAERPEAFAGTGRAT